LNGWQQQTDEYGDDRDYDQQFDEREARAAAGWFPAPSQRIHGVPPRIGATPDRDCGH
jgi:hypothetical protein